MSKRKRFVALLCFLVWQMSPVDSLLWEDTLGFISSNTNFIFISLLYFLLLAKKRLYPRCSGVRLYSSFLFLSLLFESPGRITKIFITHLHGDHFFGLPGLLCTLSLQVNPGPTKPPVDIYGPLGLRYFIQRSLELSHSQLLFPYAVHELVPTRDQCPAEEFKEFSSLDGAEVSPQGAQGRILHLDPVENSYLLLEDEQLVLKAFRLFHRIPSFGFVVEEKPRAGKLNVQKLKDLGNYIYSSF